MTNARDFLNILFGHRVMHACMVSRKGKNIYGITYKTFVHAATEGSKMAII